MLATFSGGESERTLSKFRARAHEIRKFHVAVVQPRLRNVQKSVMHAQSCCFANKPVALFAVLFTVAFAVVLAQLAIVVIQKFCYHVNVTSHVPSLLDQSCYLRLA